jgi:hypothetical protein
MNSYELGCCHLSQNEHANGNPTAEAPIVQVAAHSLN